MNIAIIGLGTQGYKRLKILKNNFITVDPYKKEADYKNIREVPNDKYDIAFISTPDKEKFKLINYCILNHKHILVEKPLIDKDIKRLIKLEQLARKNNIILYTAYNHRFEPHFIKMKNLILSKKLGKIYSCRMFYGNGTARLVKKSLWKNKGSGVLSDLGSHLLDTCRFFFGTNIG